MSDNEDHYDNYEREIRPISLVKIKKPNHIEYEKQPSNNLF